jgi:hypothetical protein
MDAADDEQARRARIARFEESNRASALGSAK